MAMMQIAIGLDADAATQTDMGDDCLSQCEYFSLQREGSTESTRVSYSSFTSFISRN